jgi:hypothetical protein
MAGQTSSRHDFPITPGAYDETYNGGQRDAFLSIMEFANGGGPIGDSPVVIITSPTDASSFPSGEATPIDFAGGASDTEDGDLSPALEWTSSIDGQIGTGGSFSTTLSAGVHSITASVTDSDNNTGSDSINITVGTPPATVSVASIEYSTTGGKNGDKHLLITFALVDDTENPVSGASLSFNLLRNGTVDSSYTGTTGSSGTVTFTRKNVPNGTYTSVVTNVTANGLTWDSVTPTNGFTK